jgi:hypothetical protein
MKNNGRILFTILSVIGAFLIGYSFLSVNKNQKEIEKDFDNYAPVKAVTLPDSYDFAGESIPLSVFYVKEQLDREVTVNTYWHSSTILWLKRAGRWFPVIEPILEEEGVPSDFKYLALIESGLQQVKSPAGAAGFWQLMEGTARDYGLEVNKYVDERYHIEKSTRAACRYIKEAFDEYDNWILVAASFNAGKRRISESIDEQYTRSFFEMHLNSETSRYVYRILAAKMIHSNPEQYGFFLTKEDLYNPLETKELVVDETIDDLPAFARKYNISYRMLKELNPWLRNDHLKVKKGLTYSIVLPLNS